MSVTLTIKLEGATEFSVTVASTEATVLELKQACVEGSGIPAAEQRLIFKGRVLKDEQTLASYKIESGVTVHVGKSTVAKDGPIAPAKDDKPIEQPPAGMAFGGLGGLPGMGPGGMPDPSKIQEVMNNPQVQQMLTDPSFIT